ncbi:DUF1691 domain containing protein [Nitzschia inconspicua]|uniref:DUF1691 domain containing protein n=1 Tax=Nitzschia inconspicua TaxID=303405 RepID=A0A9K3KLW6_9STRA|nr:DUF1691 domain containing protein [Nitzschia inconspicua]
MTTSTATFKQIQAASGLFMAIFVTMHLVNHYFLNSSYERAHSIMTLLRQVYQNPVFEVLFYVAMMTHFFANYHTFQSRSKVTKLHDKKKNDNQSSSITIGSNNKNKKKQVTTKDHHNIVDYELKGHRYAGYTLSLLVVAHVLAVRLVPLVYFDNAQDFDYSFAAMAIVLFPYQFFTIYYILLGMAGGWHLIYGVRSAIATLRGRSVQGTTFPMPLKAFASISHILLISAVLALAKYATTTTEWSEQQEKLHRTFFQLLRIQVQ